MFLCSTVDTVQNANNCINTTDDGVILIYKRCKFRSSTRSTSLITSGEVRSIVAIRFATSACFSGGRAPSTWDACAGARYEKDHRNRLRMFILYKVQQLCRICLSDKFERTNLKRCCKFCNNSSALSFPSAFSRSSFAYPIPPSAIYCCARHT